MSVGAHVRVGGYLAVLADGTICCGYQGGMKLYAYPGPAIKRAGMVMQRHSGPRVNAAIDALK